MKRVGVGLAVLCCFVSLNAVPCLADEKNDGAGEPAASSAAAPGAAPAQSSPGREGSSPAPESTPKQQAAAETTTVPTAPVVPAAAQSGQPSPAQAEPAANTPAQMRRIQMRLSGSSCTACLHELERKLRAIAGVSKCKIEYPGDNLYQAIPGAGWSLATFVMDVNKVSVDQVVQYMKTQGYHAFKVIDKGPA